MMILYDRNKSLQDILIANKSEFVSSDGIYTFVFRTFVVNIYFYTIISNVLLIFDFSNHCILFVLGGNLFVSSFI
jgi:hypothetical protein